MHGYKWPINCTRTRISARTRTPFACSVFDAKLTHSNAKYDTLQAWEAVIESVGDPQLVGFFPDRVRVRKSESCMVCTMILTRTRGIRLSPDVCILTCTCVCAQYLCYRFRQFQTITAQDLRATYQSFPRLCFPYQLGQVFHFTLDL